MDERSDLISESTPPIFGGDLTAFHDVPIRLHAELGRTRMSVRDFLTLASESIVELHVSEGEYVGVYTNGKIFARGEIIVVEGNIGIRVTEILKS